MVSIALGAVTVVLRDEVSPRAFTELLVGQIARITVIEIALVVVLAAAYAELGWWSPLLIGAVVLSSGTTTRCRRRIRSRASWAGVATSASSRPGSAGCAAG